MKCLTDLRTEEEVAGGAGRTKQNVVVDALEMSFNLVELVICFGEINCGESAISVQSVMSTNYSNNKKNIVGI